MNNFKRPAVLLVSILCLAIGIGVVPDFIRTAGVLGRWDGLCAILLLASIAAVTSWLHFVQNSRFPCVARLGWIVPTLLLLAAALACLRRLPLAEAELKSFGIRATKRAYGGPFFQSLQKAGLHLEITETWRHDLQLPPPLIASDEDLEKVASLLAIHRPQSLFFTCGESIRDLSPLKKLKDLLILNIGTVSVVDFRPLADLAGLRMLTIRTPGSAIDLRALTSVQTLYVDGVAWTELGAQMPSSDTLKYLSIANAPNLVSIMKGRVSPNLLSLHLGGVRAALSLSRLPEFAPSLESLSFDACQSVEDLEALGRLPLLISLSISNIPRFATRLPELKSLRRFRVENSQTASLDEVANAAPNLFELTIKQQVPPMDLEGIQRLRRLRHLDLFHCTITLKFEHRAILLGLPGVILPREHTRRVSKTTPPEERTRPAARDNRAR